MLISKCFGKILSRIENCQFPFLESRLFSTESGTHATLLQKQGEYYEMWQRQLEHTEKEEEKGEVGETKDK